MGVEIILHQADGHSMGVERPKGLHKLGIIDRRSLATDFHIAKAGMWLKGYKHTAGAVLPYS